MAAKKARQAISQKKLLEIEGMDAVLKNIEKTIDRMKGERIKNEAYVEAAKHVWSQAKANVQALPISDRLKTILDAEISINRGLPANPYVLCGVSQKAGIQKLGGQGNFIINPYWVEKGIAGHTRGPYSGGKPFFVPAVKSARSKVAETLKAKLLEIATDTGL